MIQQTSILAYQSLQDLGTRQKTVYNVIEYAGSICNMDIADQLQLPVNQITGRTKELVDIGLVEQSYKAKHPITGRQVIFWHVK